MPRYYTRDPDGDNSFGNRLAGAFAGAFFAVPLCLLWWGFLVLALEQVDAPFPFRYALYGVAALALFGFLFPKVLPALYGGLWKALFESGTWW